MLLELDSNVAMITRNVLERLSLPSVRIVGPVAAAADIDPQEGAPIQVYVDRSRGVQDAFSGYVWEVRGKTASALRREELTSSASIASLRAGKGGEPMTVDVVVHDNDGKRVGFGSLSFIPLTEREALAAELCTLLAEMVRPGEPSAPLVDPQLEVYELGLGLVADNLAWIGDRATRIAEITSLLRARSTGAQRDPPIAGC